MTKEIEELEKRILNEKDPTEKRRLLRELTLLTQKETRIG